MNSAVQSRLHGKYKQRSGTFHYIDCLVGNLNNLDYMLFMSHAGIQKMFPGGPKDNQVF